jgi:hypothetical protein
MMGRGGKTYSYGRTKLISFLPDGTEQATQNNESGVILINNRFVIIDGVEYVYKPYGEDPLEAILEYENNHLASVRVLLPDSEKQFFIEKVEASKDSSKRLTAVA